MADEKISTLAAAGALTGTELVEAVQGGVNVQTTTQDIANLGGGGGAVSSVFTRTGAVTAATSDYDAVQIDNTPAGNIAATNVQAALNELDSEKQTAAQVASAVAAVLATTITNGDTTHAPDGNVVFDTFATKQDSLVSGTNIKTVNGTSILGSGDIDLIDDAIVNGEAKAPSQNAVFDALALKADILILFRRETASYTLDATDLANVNAGKNLTIEMNVGSANNLTIPLNSSQAFPLGARIGIIQYGGGVTSVIGTGGVTVRLSSGVATLGGQYCKAVLIKVDTNEWYCDNGDPTVISGTWTPTLTNTTNIAASTAYLCSYSMIGNRVTVSGRVDIDPTAAGNTVLGISLPVTSAFTTANQAGGAAFSPGIAGQGAGILSDATNDRLTLQYVAVDVTNQAFYFSAGYEVI